MAFCAELTVTDDMVLSWDRLWNEYDERNWSIIVPSNESDLQQPRKFILKFDVHVTVYRVKYLIIKPTSCDNFSNLFLEWKSTYLGQILCPSSGVFHCTHSNGICHTGLLTYTIAVCTVKNSWWWTEELSEICRVSFQEQIWEISASSWSYCKKLF